MVHRSTVAVGGMSCGGCASAAEKALLGACGGGKCRVNVDTGVAALETKGLGCASSAETAEGSAMSQPPTAPRSSR